jgi:adenine phosphoribosyltransferase
VGFAEAYKDGRGVVADRMLRRTTAPDYRGRVVTLSVRARLFAPSDRVLVVDDWVVTGAQLATLRALVKEAGATYVGAAVIVDGCQPTATAELGLRSLLSRGDLD